MAGPSQPDDEPDDANDDPRPPGPFPGLPFGAAGFDLSQLMRVLQSEGPVNWEIARQIAAWVALDGGSERPVEAGAREQLDELARAAQTLVVSETGLASTFRAPLLAVGPKAWADLQLDALKPVLEALATTLGGALGAPDLDEPGIGGGADPLAAFVPMMTPLLLGLQAGSMIGYLARTTLGRYDLPLPAADEPSLCFVVPNVDSFEEEWSLPRDDLRFYVALHEVVHAAERSVPWVRQRLVRLTTEYVSAYEIDPSALEAQFGALDPNDPSALSSIAEKPEALLGAMQSPRQGELLVQLQTLTSVVEGYADTVIERVGGRLIPTFSQIHEAMRRHRLERGEAERFVEGLLGLKLDREHYERGAAFCDGVIERAGADGLNRLWEREAMLPTPPELEAAGLWLARIDLPDTDVPDSGDEPKGQE